MAELQVAAEFMAEMLLPGVERFRVTNVRPGDSAQSFVLTIEGPDVPDAAEVRAVLTLRATKHQRFIECKLEPI